jgi:hypothetical protein
VEVKQFFEEEVRTIVPIPALISKGEAFDDWLLVDLVEKHIESDGYLLVLV